MKFDQQLKDDTFDTITKSDYQMPECQITSIITTDLGLASGYATQCNDPYLWL